MEKLYLSYPEISPDEIREALDFSCSQILHVLPEFTDEFQNAYSENGFYKPIHNVDWTNGFWTGQIWLAYEYCKEQALKEAAEVQITNFLDRINRKIRSIIMIWDFCTLFRVLPDTN